MGVGTAIHHRRIAVGSLPEALSGGGLAGCLEAERAAQGIAAVLGLTGRLADQTDRLYRRVERHREHVLVPGELLQQAARQLDGHALDEAEVGVDRQPSRLQSADEPVAGPRLEPDDDRFIRSAVDARGQPGLQGLVELVIDGCSRQALGAEGNRSHEQGGKQRELEPAAPDHLASCLGFAYFVTAIHNQSPVRSHPFA